jgi:hypothetical protein
LVGIQVNSHLIPGKKFKLRLLSIPGAFQVIPGHSGWNPGKKKMFIFSPIPGIFQVIPTIFPPHSRSIPGSFQAYSRHIPGKF